MPLSWPYGVTGPVVGQMFHVKHWLWWRSCSGRRMARPWGRAASCTRGRRPSCCCCLWSHGCSGRRRPRPPARLGNLAPLGVVPRSPPVPSGPSGALHNSGAWWLIGGWARRLEARPGLAAARQHPGLVLRSGGAAACLLVVTLVLRAPSGPAAREIAARELRSEWSISKPALALRTLRRPPHRRRRCTLACARG